MILIKSIDIHELYYIAFERIMKIMYVDWNEEKIEILLDTILYGLIVIWKKLKFKSPSIVKIHRIIICYFHITQHIL